ncbi:MAG: hypothetical protein SCH70_09750 [Candidatus Methanoperedens sp.]|nr:hypothetical protein [Candidatus Methanoperedens sp.]
MREETTACFSPGSRSIHLLHFSPWRRIPIFFRNSILAPSLPVHAAFGPIRVVLADR